MFEQPKISNQEIIDFLSQNYEIKISKVEHLSLGADFNAAVFRVTTKDNAPYFLKLRSGDFDEASLLVPHFLRTQGIDQIIPVVPGINGALWSNLKSFAAVLYPFIEGKDGYELTINQKQCQDFAKVLKKFHSTPFPDEILKLIPKETYSDRYRQAVKRNLHDIKGRSYDDIVAKQAAESLKKESSRILKIVLKTDSLARELHGHPPKMIVCHTDLHAGNLHITPSGELYIVDWDQPLLAPKERDLMFVGAGLLSSGLTPAQEQELFYRAYGPVDINQHVISYYRYERIIRDIYEFYELLLNSSEGSDEDRAQYLFYLKSIFDPGGVVDIAIQGDIHDP